MQANPTPKRIKPSEALKAHRQEILELIKKGNGRNPRVLGSVATGTDTEDSDLDLLIDYVEGTGGFRFYGIAVDIEKLIGIKVDIFTPGGFKEDIRPQVLASAVPL